MGVASSRNKVVHTQSNVAALSTADITNKNNIVQQTNVGDVNDA